MRACPAQLGGLRYICTCMQCQVLLDIMQSVKYLIILSSQSSRTRDEIRIGLSLAILVPPVCKVLRRSTIMQDLPWLCMSV